MTEPTLKQWKRRAQVAEEELAAIRKMRNLDADREMRNARENAAQENPALTEARAGLYNRDMRSRAADLSDDLDSAAKLLQHGSKKIAADHYRNKPEKLRAVR